MSGRSKSLALAAGRTTLHAIRFSLYIVLLLVGRVLVPVAGLATAGGLILFFFCLFFVRDQTHLLVLGACLAAGGVVLQVFYDAALRLVAPEGVVIVGDL